MSAHTHPRWCLVQPSPSRSNPSANLWRGRDIIEVPKPIGAHTPWRVEWKDTPSRPRRFFLRFVKVHVTDSAKTQEAAYNPWMVPSTSAPEVFHPHVHIEGAEHHPTVPKPMRCNHPQGRTVRYRMVAIDGLSYLAYAPVSDSFLGSVRPGCFSDSAKTLWIQYRDGTGGIQPRMSSRRRCCHAVAVRPRFSSTVPKPMSRHIIGGRTLNHLGTLNLSSPGSGHWPGASARPYSPVPIHLRSYGPTVPKPMSDNMGCGRAFNTPLGVQSNPTRLLSMVGTSVLPSYVPSRPIGPTLPKPLTYH